MITVKVKYLRGYTETQYNFKTDDETIKVGDYCVVENSSGYYSMVEVTEIDQENSYKAKKWIVDKIDVAKYKEKLEIDKKLQSIKAKLDKKKTVYEEMAMYELLAQKDEEAKELLAEYKAIVG